jgi:hypothetical protein
MSLTLHTNYTFGSYLADRTEELKLRENPDLKKLTGDPRQLRPHFDGNNSLALGYGFDLLVRDNAEILVRLSSAGLSDAAVGWVNGPDGTAADKKIHDLNLLDIYRQSRSGLSTTEWQNRAGKLFLNLPSEPKATDLLNVLAADAETKLSQALFSRGIQINDSRERLGTEKGTGYFSGDVFGRPRCRSVDSRPKRVAVTVCQSGVPNGCWRFTQVRSVVSSCSKSGWSIQASQSVGVSTGIGSLRCGNRRLDQGQSMACVTSPARTGLRST